MIERCQSNLLNADAEVLVNTVNCVGIMGKGIALAFKKKFAKNFFAYEQACKDGLVVPGRMFIVPTGALWNPRYIVNFPTKYHWRARSKLEDVKTGLEALVADVRALSIRSIAVPPLGCGHGGLDWHDVAPLIERAFAALPEVRVLLFEPRTPPPHALSPGAKMTLGRAMLLSMMASRPNPGSRYDISEIQLLAYLLQKSGQPLRLTFRWRPRGPWAVALGRVLRDMEGTFIRGSEDDEDCLYLLPEAAIAARAFLQEHATARQRVEHLQGLLSSFNGSHDLALLGKILWVAEQEEAVGEAAAIALVSAKDGSRERYSPMEIREVWSRLYRSGWFSGGLG
jgi:O-acetyl-ADP-ribose deacetylase (regulator of RNase III)